VSALGCFTVPSIKGTFIMRVLMVSANTEQLNMPVLSLGMACVSAAIQSAGHDRFFGPD
jgi:hypothetical protein